MNNDRFSIGSEYAELDSNLENVVIPHPVFWQVNGAFPAIVFGDEGMGKTASALWLVKRCQALAALESAESRVFPVYASYESPVDMKEFLVERISRSLLDFISDNPRRFLNAPYAQKTAMGRLILRYSKSKEPLGREIFTSPFDPSVGDLDQVLEYISTLQHSSAGSLTEEEALHLLYMARPDAFDQIYFIWDIRSAVPREEVVGKIKSIENLALPLARQNIFLKIFAPSTAKEALGRLASFRLASDLVWNEFQLRELIDTRVKMFSALWDRGIDDPGDLVVSASEHSPRRVIQILIALLDYVDKHLSEGEKLNNATLDQAIISLQS